MTDTRQTDLLALADRLAEVAGRCSYEADREVVVKAALALRAQAAPAVANNAKLVAECEYHVEHCSPGVSALLRQCITALSPAPVQVDREATRVLVSNIRSFIHLPISGQRWSMETEDAIDAIAALIAAPAGVDATEQIRLRGMADSCAQSILGRLIANYETQRDKIGDSDLDNEQPLALTFYCQLGDIRNAQKALQCFDAMEGKNNV